MTVPRGRDWLLGLMLAVGLAACSRLHDTAAEIGGPGLPQEDDDSGTSATERDAGIPGPQVTCATAARETRLVLETYCASCHGPGSPGEGNFSSVLDERALVDSGLVIPDDPDNSVLYQRMATNSMPPAAEPKRPGQSDLDAVRAWITCGAVAQEPGVPPESWPRDSLAVMRADLRDLTKKERLDVRYLDLTPLDGLSASELAAYRDALTVLLNSLSHAPEIALPQAIDDEQLLLRIRLSAYGWTPGTWERIVADYPYAIAYDEDGELFDFDATSAEDLQQDTGTLIPHVHADWFFAHAARPPLYYDILALPPTLAELEAQLGIGIAANIAGGTAARAGFLDSGPSLYNRAIERHAIGDQGRSLWLTYDVQSDEQASNVLVHPLDFVSDGSEIMVGLPNGLQAFMIVDASGVRLERASDGVQDPLARDQVTEAGLSCLSCHAEDGILGATDQVREASAALTDATLVSAIESLYPLQADLDRLFAADAARYRTARTALGATGYGVGSAHELVSRYEQPLRVEDLAAILGIEATELQRGLEYGRGLPASLTALALAGDATIDRFTLEAVFPDLVRGIGLGESIGGGATDQ